MKPAHQRIAPLFVALAAAFATTSALAAESADLSVTGAIRPTACDVSVSTNQLDSGTIPARTLSQTDMTVLDSRQVTVNVSCDAGTALAISTADGRAGTAQAGALRAISADIPDTFAYGLGEVDGRRIGAYAVSLGDATVDGAAGNRLRKDTFESQWYSVTNPTHEIIRTTRCGPRTEAQRHLRPQCRSVPSVRSITFGL
jgi:type 1 fimbria pilin